MAQVVAGPSPDASSRAAGLGTRGPKLRSMHGGTLGQHFESEIWAQPDVWQRLAASDSAARLAAALDDDIVLVGSGSSLFVAQLGALALRRRGLRAQALAATEVRLDHRSYERKIVVAVSQSGTSSDLFAALDVLDARRLIALTNTAASPLAARADLVIDIGAGPELAVPATKSVSSSVAVLLWAASLVGGDRDERDGIVLRRAAASVRAWFAGAELGETIDAAQNIARRRSVVVLGSDYGLPVANETALKLKEASYLHAEGFAAGEFRHGSIAMVDASSSVLGIVDADALEIVARPLRELAKSGAQRYTLGSPAINGLPALGPEVETPYNTLGWLVTIQVIALYAARARGIESDAPRGLSKALIGRID